MRERCTFKPSRTDMVVNWDLFALVVCTLITAGMLLLTESRWVYTSKVSTPQVWQEPKYILFTYRNKHSHLKLVCLRRTGRSVDGFIR